MTEPFLVDPTLISLPAALTLGFVFGLGPCLVACLPTLGPVFLCAGEGVRKAWKLLLPVVLGRLVVYVTYGALAAYLGHHLEHAVPGAHLNLLVGAATALLGLALLLRRSQSANNCCTAEKPLEQPVRWLPKGRGLLPSGLFMVGIGLALTPCGPLTAVLGAAAMTSNPIEGALLGLMFGLGAQIGSILVYGFGVAYFGHQLREQLGPWREKIQWLSGGMLFCVGLLYVVKAAMA